MDKLHNCYLCGEPIKEEDLILLPDELGTIASGEPRPDLPYHKRCIKIIQEDTERMIDRNRAKKIAEEQDIEEQEAELRVHLLKGRWFLKGAQTIIRKNPLYYDRTGAWWMWNDKEKYWTEKDETDILVMVRRQLQLLGDTSVMHSKKLLEALRQVSREHEPQEPPLHMIQLGSWFYDLNTKQQSISTPYYFSTNRIPWSLGTTNDTPQMDALIDSWVGERYRQTLYEIIAYCTYRDYPIHRMFYLVGTGANGKTRFIKLLEKFIGINNKASVTLKKIGGNNFALYPLYRKSVCFIGETSHHKLESTEILKALSGQNPVDFEAKGRNGFSGTNYAKLIVDTNVIPNSTDTSRGWHRRQFILVFPNEFVEGEDVLLRIPDQEYHNLARKCMEILPGLLHNGSFTGEGSIEVRQQRYVEQANPIKIFLEEQYVRDEESHVRYGDCYLAYLSFLGKRRLRRISKKEFTSLLEDEGLETEKSNFKDIVSDSYKQVFMVCGIKRKKNSTDSTDSTGTSVLTILVPFPKESGINSTTGTIGTIGTLASVPQETEVTALASKNELLTTISLLGGSTTIQTLQDLYPGDPITHYLTELCKNGDLYEQPKDTYRIPR